VLDNDHAEIHEGRDCVCPISSLLPGLMTKVTEEGSMGRQWRVKNKSTEVDWLKPSLSIATDQRQLRQVT
jgi:hypothetical protein